MYVPPRPGREQAHPARRRTLTATMLPAEGWRWSNAASRPWARRRRSSSPSTRSGAPSSRCGSRWVGRYRGNWGTDKYEGPAYRFTLGDKSQVVMLSEANEIVSIDFGEKMTLALTGQPKSRRYEDNLPKPRPTAVRRRRRNRPRARGRRNRHACPRPLWPRRRRDRRRALRRLRAVPARPVRPGLEPRRPTVVGAVAGLVLVLASRSD